MTLQEKIEHHKKFIYVFEIGCLLHDIGKLDSRFIDYRKKWQKNEGGWNYKNDPHDDEEKPYFDCYAELEKLGYSNLIGIVNSFILFDCFPRIPFKEIIHKHRSVENDECHPARFLKLGDSMDSAYDRNNPFYVNEQLYPDETFLSTVFGYEKKIDIENLDNSRNCLFRYLNENLSKYFDSFEATTRTEIFKEIEKYYSCTVSDTTRPANDTTLWQHTYVSTALAKVFVAHYLIYDEVIPEFSESTFSLLGYGWDGLSFLSKGHKIGDIVGRKNIIRETKQEIKKILEFDIPIGMNIYDDDNGIYFVIPTNRKNDGEPTEQNKVPEVAEYNALLSEIHEKIIQTVNTLTDGELLPVVSCSNETHFIMDIVKVIDGVRKQSAFPYDEQRQNAKWMTGWEKSENKICPVCEIRPLKNDTINEKATVCHVCSTRRDNAREKNDTQSIFSSEIADTNGRLCLLVAKFNLRPWLSGDMLWSLFVKDMMSMKKATDYLTKIEDEKFKNTDEERKKCIPLNFQFNYNSIVSFFDDNTIPYELKFFFSRHTNEIKKDESSTKIKNWLTEINESMDINTKYHSPADIYTYLLTKNHTPSRLLNVWNTTRDFLKDIFNDKEIKKLLPLFRRAEITLENNENITKMNDSLYEAEIEGEKIEIFRKENNTFYVLNAAHRMDEKSETEWIGKEITIQGNEFKKNFESISSTITYVKKDTLSGIFPYRTITESPDLLLAIIPGDKAIEITTRINKLYEQHFGKVKGRLPLHCGNIFFTQQMPMSVVLDAGKKMEHNFDVLQHEYWENSDAAEIVKAVKDNNGRTQQIEFSNGTTWNLEQSLGSNCSIDYFHPYAIVANSPDNEHQKKQSYFKTFLGDLVHFSDIEEGYTLKIFPNYYDFEFLDSTTRRFDIPYDDEKKHKRRSNLTGALTKPILLDELEQKFQQFWKDITLKKNYEHITDTKLRNIESLLFTKMKEWNVDVSKKEMEEFKEWSVLVANLLQKEFPDLRQDERKQLNDFITSGLFFDCLELYLRILKLKISPPNKRGKQ